MNFLEGYDLGRLVAITLVFAVLIAIGPLVTIWALNTLFGLAIAYSFKTWFATAWLGLMLASRK